MDRGNDWLNSGRQKFKKEGADAASVVAGLEKLHAKIITAIENVSREEAKKLEEAINLSEQQLAPSLERPEMETSSKVRSKINHQWDKIEGSLTVENDDEDSSRSPCASSPTTKIRKPRRTGRAATDTKMVAVIDSAQRRGTKAGTKKAHIELDLCQKVFCRAAARYLVFRT